MEQGRSDRVLRWARLVLRVLAAVNLLSGVGFAACAVLSVPFAGWIEAHMLAKYGAGFDAGSLLWAMRVLFVLGAAASVAGRAVLEPLMGIIDTVGAGDPFAAENARRLETVGRGLLAWQLLDLGLGAVVGWIDRLGAEHAGWMPSVAGWVTVLLVFVLARVFRRGAEMRDELEGTV